MEQIERAFAGVELGEGVSLHETIAVDGYGSHEERQAARADDEKHDWRKLIHDPELWKVDGNGGISFYDAAGLHFHLPAYLSCWVMDPEDFPVASSLIYHMTSMASTIDDHARACGMAPDDPVILGHFAHMQAYYESRLSLLDNAQRQCVRQVLLYVREQPSYEGKSPDIDRALEGFWRPA